MVKYSLITLTWTDCETQVAPGAATFNTLPMVVNFETVPIWSPDFVINNALDQDN